ncbi:MAG: zinc-finger domain-containing protein [Pseudomonadota bacterium]|nr:zinc-finger domain-containing protein [Pseudomonadota bacterium]
MSENSTNSKTHYEVTYADLPLHCPTDDMSLWNSHPRVFLPIEKTGHAKCPYCGAEYTLIDFDPNHIGGH